MSRRQEEPQGFYLYPDYASFPVVGRNGYKYRADDTGEMFIFHGGSYEPYGGSIGGGATVASISNPEIQLILDTYS